uniref:Uncharacterized protein n=1 Tax=Panagrolaimus sp. JU765 TaxID=591449 RepID=A0AC34REH6_9BILA
MKSLFKIFVILFGILFLVSSAVHGQDQDVFKVFDNWLIPFKKEQGKRSFSDLPFEDEDVLIPLMKKGRPRGPPRFGKRSANPAGFRPVFVYGPFRDQLHHDVDNF